MNLIVLTNNLSQMWGSLMRFDERYLLVSNKTGQSTEIDGRLAPCTVIDRLSLEYLNQFLSLLQISFSILTGSKNVIQ